jgi:hypothetical protein
VTSGFSRRWWGPGTVFPRQAERPEQSRVLEGDDPRDPRNGDRGHQIADTLVGAFAHHYRCELPGDAELLQRIGHPAGDALEILVASGAVPLGDALPVGLMILSALAGFRAAARPRCSSAPPETQIQATSAALASQAGRVTACAGARLTRTARGCR